MNELDKNYQKKAKILKDLKDLFYKNKAMFIEEFSGFSIVEKAKLIAFIQVNDTKFYNQIKMLIDVKEQNMTKTVEKEKKTEKSDAELQIEKDAAALARRADINKIKVDKKVHAMTIMYSGSNKKGGKETTFTGYEEMLSEKYDLIQSLKYPVMEILEFPEEWEDDIVVTGISLNHDPEHDNALRGMVVTMQKDVNNLNCPLNINTPFIKFSEYIDDYSPYPCEESCWDYDTGNKVAEIINNAYMYICGDSKTIQTKML